jgi:phosphoglycerol transferase
MNKSLSSIFRYEWKLCMFGAAFSLIFANVLMSGWSSGIIPNLAYPYVYNDHDGLLSSWIVQRLIEGWIYENPRSGFPFGSNFLDFPIPDLGNLIVLKLLGFVTGNYYKAINLYFLLSFPVTFIASYCVLRVIDLRKILAFCAAIIFVFLPFHFQRLNYGHIFYSWYFVVPLFFYIGYIIFNYDLKQNKDRITTKKSLTYLFGIFILTSFGVYYSLFGAIIISIAGISASFKSRSFVPLGKAVAALLVIVFSLLIILSPNILNRYTNGVNHDVAVRTPAEAEVYALTMKQLLLPRTDHRLDYFAKFSSFYSKNGSAVNENSTSTLGLIGSLGFIFLWAVIILVISGKKFSPNTTYIALLTLILFLFATIGGLGAIFSSLISPLIRAWNRISIFIAFCTISGFFILFQNLLKQHFFSKISNSASYLLSCALLIIGLYDQTISTCNKCNQELSFFYNNDKDFIQKIENELPPSSAVYQLPYMKFPETPPLNRLNAYDLAIGYLNSNSLHWSYGGMKGRDGDLFYQALSQEPIEIQLKVIYKLGFSGIYIDRRGFDDNAEKIISQLSTLVGPPLLTHKNGEIVFFSLPNNSNLKFNGLSTNQLIEYSGFDKLGTRFQANLSDGIDFSRRDWPSFIKNISGISIHEPWGRWSDANISPYVQIDFENPLPQKFTLSLSGRTFESNMNLTIEIGNFHKKTILLSNEFEFQSNFDLNGENIYSIKFIPENPSSPFDLKLSIDKRRLGVGFKKLNINEIMN